MNEQQQAHDNAVESGKKLLDAQAKLDEAENLLREANLRMSNARKFEEILKDRQRRLDRAFVLLNKQKRLLQARELRANDRESLIDKNIANF